MMLYLPLIVAFLRQHALHLGGRRLLQLPLLPFIGLGRCCTGSRVQGSFEGFERESSV